MESPAVDTARYESYDVLIAGVCCQRGCQPRTLDVRSLQDALLAQGAELRRPKGMP